MDRGYARVRNVKAALAGGGDFITRISWGSVKLRDAEGLRSDLPALLANTTQNRNPSAVPGRRRERSCTKQ